MWGPTPMAERISDALPRSPWWALNGSSLQGTWGLEGDLCSLPLLKAPLQTKQIWVSVFAKLDVANVQLRWEPSPKESFTFSHLETRILNCLIKAGVGEGNRKKSQESGVPWKQHPQQVFIETYYVPGTDLGLLGPQLEWESLSSKFPWGMLGALSQWPACRVPREHKEVSSYRRRKPKI